MQTESLNNNNINESDAKKILALGLIVLALPFLGVSAAIPTAISFFTFSTLIMIINLIPRNVNLNYSIRFKTYFKRIILPLLL
ncbi:MAG: hypothetical protein Q8888_02305 [Vigna little leaf phytoplasma]|nr:hypothetical protein [Vigna little leaf phytoplasma]